MKDDQVYLLHIRDSIDRILDYTKAGPAAFLADTKTQDAVIRNLEVIGEAVKSISADLKSAYPDIPWQRIAGMRDRMIHEYFGVNLQIVWEKSRERRTGSQNERSKNIIVPKAAGRLDIQIGSRQS